MTYAISIAVAFAAGNAFFCGLIHAVVGGSREYKIAAVLFALTALSLGSIAEFGA